LKSPLKSPDRPFGKPMYVKLDVQYITLIKFRFSISVFVYIDANKPVSQAEKGEKVLFTESTFK
jgi:hypothetical protein